MWFAHCDQNFNSCRVIMILMISTMLTAVSCAKIKDVYHHYSFNRLRNPLQEGDKCRTQTGDSGVCKNIMLCEKYKQKAASNTIDYDSVFHCGFNGFIAVICCPLQNTTHVKAIAMDPSTDSPIKTTPTLKTPSTGNIQNERPSKEACREWRGLDPAAVGPHILNGNLVPAGTFAHMGALIQLMSSNPTKFELRCGSSLIAPRYVLTAAHCVQNPRIQPNIVRFGAVNLNLEENSEDDYEIKNYIIHDDNISPSGYHDIAILELYKNVAFTPYVKPACLFSDVADIDSAKQLVVIGWGVTNVTTRTQSDTLLSTNVTTVPLSECNVIHINHGIDRSYNRGIIEGQYCAYDKELERDACSADSGGPLQLIENNEAAIVAVVSFGHSCGTMIPSIYTRVAFYLDWIEKKVVWAS